LLTVVSLGLVAMLGVLLLGECGGKQPPNMISFDRASLALTIADLGGSLRQACFAGKLTKGRVR